MAAGNMRWDAVLKDHGNSNIQDMERMYFDRHLRIGFFFDSSYYVRDIDIKDVEDDSCQKVWRWWGTDNLITHHRHYVFELLGEKDDDGRILVSGEMFLNVMDNKTREQVTQITRFDIDICC